MAKLALPLLLLLVVAILPVANVYGQATTYPACPFTGKPAKKPATPPPRCPAAGNLSCCPDCSDLNMALGLVGTNLSSVVYLIGPTFPDFIDPSLTVCDLFASHMQCAQLIEDLMCGLTCNPNSGSYVSAAPGTNITMTVCSDFSKSLFKACNGLSAGDGMDLTLLISEPNDFLTVVVANVIKTLGLPNFQFAFSTTSCFTSSGIYPPNTACCDPLTVPPSCPANAVNTTKYADLIGRTIDPATCAASPPSPPAAAPGASPPAAAPGSAPPPALPGSSPPPAAAPPATAPTSGSPPVPTSPSSPAPPSSPSPSPPPPKSGSPFAAAYASVLSYFMCGAVALLAL